MLDIDMKFKHGILIVRLKGVLNNKTSHLLKTNLEETIKNNGIRYVLLNLKYLKKIDDYGLVAIESSYNEILKNNGKLILCGANKVFKENEILTDNLYQVSEEITAYEMINIWKINVLFYWKMKILFTP